MLHLPQLFMSLGSTQRGLWSRRVVLLLGGSFFLFAQNYQTPIWNGKQYIFPIVDQATLPISGSSGNGPLKISSAAQGVPYVGATQDLNLGTHTLIAGSVVVNGNGNTNIGLTAGTAPNDTTVNGKAYDAILYLDTADMKLKMRKKDGTIAQIEMTP